MRAALWNAIHEMLDAADYAIDKLNNYTDYNSDPYSLDYGPNGALSAQECLKDAYRVLESLMEKEAKE